MSPALPLAVERYLTPQRLGRDVAHVLVGSGGEVAASGGALSRFGLDRSGASRVVDMFTPWFEPEAPPQDRATINFVEFTPNTYADVHFVADGDRTWIVLVDASSDAALAHKQLQERLRPQLVDLRSVKLSPEGHDPAALDSVLGGLEIGTFVRVTDNTFVAAGKLPSWLELVETPLVEQNQLRPAVHPVLQYFLPEAEEAWAKRSETPVTLLVWAEELTNGEIAHLQASAMCLPRCDALLVRRLSQSEIENSANVQRANDQALHAADAERRLYNEGERLRVTLESIAEAVLTTGPDGHIEFMNPAAERLTGWALHEAQGHSSDDVLNLVHDATGESVASPVLEALLSGELARSAKEATLVGRTGGRYGVRDSAAPIFDANGALLGVVVVLQDVTTMRAIVRQALHQAEHDSLTGLANRREFEQRVALAVARSERAGQQHAICYLDLNAFKAVNDAHGHHAGDAVLQQVAARLQATVRSGDTLARIGGDEFCVLLERCTVDAAERVANELLAAIDQAPFEWECHRFRIGVSIGIAEFTPENQSVAEAMAHADKACYAAKRESGSAVGCYQTATGTTRLSTFATRSDRHRTER